MKHKLMTALIVGVAAAVGALLGKEIPTEQIEKVIGVISSL